MAEGQVHTLRLPKANVQLDWKDDVPVVRGDVDLLIKEVRDGIQTDPTCAMMAWMMDVLRRNVIIHSEPMSVTTEPATEAG